jgi:hypothetical protein
MARAKRVKKLEPIPVRLDPDVRQGIETLAKADDRSISGYINRVLRQHLETVTGKAKPAGTKT